MNPSRSNRGKIKGASVKRHSRVRTRASRKKQKRSIQTLAENRSSLPNLQNRSLVATFESLSATPISGWIVSRNWANNAGGPISSFKTTWTVPPPPRTHSGQIIFIFNGLENNVQNSILQPVLQWQLPVDGTSGWSINSRYVDRDGKTSASASVAVSPGTSVTGIMRLIQQTNGAFMYTCEFEGIPSTVLQTGWVDELTFAVETLEAYGVRACTDYPDTNLTAMNSIEILTNGRPANITWRQNDIHNECGQKTVVIDFPTAGTEVDIYYRS